MQENKIWKPKQRTLIFPQKQIVFPLRARQTASPLAVQTVKHFSWISHLVSYSIGRITVMPVFILHANIKLLNASFYLVFILLIVSFRAPHGNLLLHFYIQTTFPFQEDSTLTSFISSLNTATVRASMNYRTSFPHNNVRHCHLISLLSGYYFFV